MGVRLVAGNTLSNALREKPEWEDSTIDQRETTVDGQTFHWAPGQRRNFLDDGVGLAHAGFNTSDQIVEDTIPFEDSRS